MLPEFLGYTFNHNKVQKFLIKINRTMISKTYRIILLNSKNMLRLLYMVKECHFQCYCNKTRELQKLLAFPSQKKNKKAITIFK